MRSYSRREVSTADEASEALKIGRAAVEAGNLDKGLEVYQSILEIDPDNKLVRERIRKLGARPAIKPPKLSRIRLAPLSKVEELINAADSGRFLAVLGGFLAVLGRGDGPNGSAPPVAPFLPREIPNGATAPPFRAFLMFFVDFPLFL